MYATLVQTAFHPGFCFPRLSSRWTPTMEEMEEKTSRDISDDSVFTRAENA